MFEGKIHNIETIKGKNEQNMFVISKIYKDSDFRVLDDKNLVLEFNIPVLIHTTVPVPRKEENFNEVYIPKTAKVYINFLKKSKAESLKERYSTDCLFNTKENPFVCVGMIEDTIQRKIYESHPTLNNQVAEACFYTTMFFTAVGFFTFIRILILAAISDSALSTSGFKQKLE